MAGRVIRFPDPERRSRDADALGPRDPCDSAVIIILPMVRIERYDDDRTHLKHWTDMRHGA